MKDSQVEVQLFDSISFAAPGANLHALLPLSSFMSDCATELSSRALLFMFWAFLFLRQRRRLRCRRLLRFCFIF